MPYKIYKSKVKIYVIKRGFCEVRNPFKKQ